MNCVEYVRNLIEDLNIDGYVEVDESLLCEYESVDEMVCSLINSGSIFVDSIVVCCSYREVYVDVGIVRGDNTKLATLIFKIDDDYLKYCKVESRDKLDVVDVLLLNEIKELVLEREEYLIKFLR